MNDLRKAAGEALEALEDVPYMSNKDDYERLERVKTALRQALETDQEPVAWANSFDLRNFDMKVRTCPDLHHTAPLYTAPPKQWVGLTSEEREHFRGLGFVGVLAVEAKLREKNHG